jgi:hypothetical protein
VEPIQKWYHPTLKNLKGSTIIYFFYFFKNDSITTLLGSYIDPMGVVCFEKGLLSEAKNGANHVY